MRRPMDPPLRTTLSYANPRRAGPPADLGRAWRTLAVTGLPLAVGILRLALLAAAGPKPLAPLFEYLGLVIALMAGLGFIASVVGLVRTPARVENGRAARRLYLLALLAVVADLPVLLWCLEVALRGGT